MQVSQRDVRGQLMEMVQVNRQRGRGDLIEKTVAGEAEEEPSIRGFTADRLAPEIDKMATVPLANLLSSAESLESRQRRDRGPR